MEIEIVNRDQAIIDRYYRFYYDFFERNTEMVCAFKRSSVAKPATTNMIKQ